jgi:hypothetical protein|tara:strand:- start:306 stop:533 length:228 start_codon:yes stop_codon:yes gene_type:complete
MSHQDATPAQQYLWCLSSVDLINAIVADDTDHYEPADCVDRNVQHLQLMVAKDFWTNEDMTPLMSAIRAGLAYGS